MRVKENREFWGGTEFQEDSPEIKIFHDVVYIPSSTQFFIDRDLEWGIYSADGHLIKDAAYIRGPTGELVGQSSHRDLAGIEFDDAPFEEMVYGGPIIAHYGHFVLTSLARLWAMDGSSQVLFHSHPPVCDHTAEYIVEVLKYSGLNALNCRSFEQPTRIRKLIVPLPSIIEQIFVSAAYSRSIRKIGDNIPNNGRFMGKHVYVSKSRMNLGVTRLSGEKAIENEFKRRGFEITYPETMSFIDQVNMFRNAKLVAGTAGSGFHTLAFVPQTKCERYVFDYLDATNANFALLDYGCEIKSKYYSMKEFVSRSTDASAFAANYEVSDLDGLIRQMVEIVQPPDGTIQPAATGNTDVWTEIDDAVRSQPVALADTLVLEICAARADAATSFCDLQIEAYERGLLSTIPTAVGRSDRVAIFSSHESRPHVKADKFQTFVPIWSDGDMSSNGNYIVDDRLPTLRKENGFGEMRQQFHVWRHRLEGLSYVGFERDTQRLVFPPLIQTASERLKAAFEASPVAEANWYQLVDAETFGDLTRSRERATLEEVARLRHWLSGYDVVVPLPYCQESIEQQWYSSHGDRQTWRVFMLAVLRTSWMKRRKLLFDLHEPRCYFCNMYVMGSVLFDEYMQLWGEVILNLRGQIDFDSRLPCMLSERLFNIFLSQKKAESLLRIAEVPLFSCPQAASGNT